MSSRGQLRLGVRGKDHGQSSHVYDATRHGCCRAGLSHGLREAGQQGLPSSKGPRSPIMTLMWQARS